MSHPSDTSVWFYYFLEYPILPYQFKDSRKNFKHYWQNTLLAEAGTPDCLTPDFLVLDFKHLNNYQSFHYFCKDSFNLIKYTPWINEDIFISLKTISSDVWPYFFSSCTIFWRSGCNIVQCELFQAYQPSLHPQIHELHWMHVGQHWMLSTAR